MSGSIVAFVDYDDHDYRAVLDALRGRGHDVLVVELARPAAFTDLRLTFEGFRIEQEGTVVTEAMVATAAVVVYRRWRMAHTPIVASALVNEDDRRFAEREWAAAFAAILRLAETKASHAAWLNLFSADCFSRDKLTLLRSAHSVGLCIPPFIVATRAEAPASHVVAKAINTDESIGAGRTFATTALSSAMLNEYLGQAAHSPSLLQQQIQADYEYRVFVIKRDVVAVRVSSEGHHDDIRYADPGGLVMARVELSPDLSSQLSRLTAHLGLSYCAFDVLCANGDTYLVDITPNGRWSPYDSEAGELTTWVADAIEAMTQKGQVVL